MTDADMDARRMALALELAGNGLYSAAPNPRVGCVVFRDGEVVGRGWHRAAGEAHAEVMALAQAGERAVGGEVYVTLEPCAHFGRTPPCVDALLRARPARVVVAMRDPDPRVGGQGLARLRAAGIRTDCGVLRRRALELNCGFVSRQLRGRPWLRLKIAATLDGRTALSSGLSKWITGAAARADAHHWRARSCAMLTGVGTAAADDPELTVRHVATARQPLRVLLDRALRAPPALKLLSDGHPTLVVCAAAPPPPRAVRGAVEFLRLPDAENADNIDLPGLLKALALRGVNEATAEAGRKLCGAFLRAGLVDELVAYYAPKLFGEDARAMFALPSPATPDAAPQLELVGARAFGGDLRVVFRRPGVFRDWEKRLADPREEGGENC